MIKFHHIRFTIVTFLGILIAESMIGMKYIDDHGWTFFGVILLFILKGIIWVYSSIADLRDVDWSGNPKPERYSTLIVGVGFTLLAAFIYVVNQVPFNKEVLIKSEGTADNELISLSLRLNQDYSFILTARNYDYYDWTEYEYYFYGDFSLENDTLSLESNPAKKYLKYDRLLIDSTKQGKLQLIGLSEDGQDEEYVFNIIQDNR